MMEDTTLPNTTMHITPINTSAPPPPPISASAMQRKQPNKYPRPLKNPTASLPPVPASKSTVTSLPPKQQSENLPSSQPIDKLVPKKPLGDARLSKAATIKADKAAEKAAEVAALVAGRASLEKKIDKSTAILTDKLAAVENNIEKMEDDYIRTTWAHGNVLRGWDGLGRRADRPEKITTGNGSGVGTGAPKHRKSRPSDRIFSLSSSTSTFRLQNPDVTIQKRPPSNKKKKKRS